MCIEFRSSRWVEIVVVYQELDHSCNKYCDLIGQSEGSILHRKPCNYLESHVTHLESHVTYLQKLCRALMMFNVSSHHN